MKKKAYIGASISLFLAPIFSIGMSFFQPAVSQVFRCSDTSLGQDERAESRGGNSRSESSVVVGQDCEDSNFFEYLDQQDQRDAELEYQRMRDWREGQEREDAQRAERMDRAACEFYGINSPNCTHEGLRQQARQEEEIERQRQLESAQVQQEQEQENYYRQRVETARNEVRSIQESIVFWNNSPDFRQPYEQRLPLAQADLQQAEQELQNYLNQRNGR